jgi:hypothetical protein
MVLKTRKARSCGETRTIHSAAFLSVDAIATRGLARKMRDLRHYPVHEDIVFHIASA